MIAFWQKLKQNFPRQHQYLLILWLLSITVVTFFAPSVTTYLDNKILDNWQLATMPLRKPSNNIMVVGIDAETLAMVKERWPWSRGKYAELLNKIEEASPEYVVWDILLQQPQNLIEDQKFAKAIVEAKNVCLVSYLTDKSYIGGRRKILYQNFPLIRNSALLEGFVWTIIDADGVSRRFVLSDKDLGINSCLSQIYTLKNAKSDHPKASEDSTVQSLMRYATSGGDIPFISASSFLNDEISKNSLSGKTLIVGGTASVLHDLHRTACGVLTGPKVLAVQLDTLFKRHLIKDVSSNFFRSLFIITAVLLSFLFLVHFNIGIIYAIVASTFVAIIVWVIIFEGFLIYIQIAPFILVNWLVSLSLYATLRILELVEMNVLKAEADAAGVVQKQLFPKAKIDEEGFLLDGFCQPCSDAGGDFYDFFIHKSGKVFFAVADVVGHGIPAAIVTSMIKTIISTNRTRNIFDLEGCVKELNSVLVQEFQRRKMVTGIFGIFDKHTGECNFAIAGHPVAILFKVNGDVVEIGYNCSPLGLLRKENVNYTNLVIEKGESLVVYTDGIVEALNWENEQFGHDRWKDSLKNNIAKVSKEGFSKMLLNDMFDFTKNRSLDDDLTVFMLHRKHEE